MEDTRIFEFVKELAELNKELEFGTGRRLEGAEGYDSGWSVRFFTNASIKDLSLPEGFYINDKGKITNKSGMMDSNYLEFAVGDISKANCKVNDISTVNKDGYTSEELAMMSKEEKEEEKIEEDIPIKKDAPFSPSFEEFRETKKPVYKNLKAKVKGLYQKLFKTAKNTYEKVSTLGNKGQGLNDITQKDIDAISNLFSKIKDDKYILEKMSNEGSFEEMLRENPKLCVERLKDYSMIKEFHDFAINDKQYDENRFETIMNDIINLKQNHTSRANRLLQETRYGGIENNQLDFLSRRIEFYKNNQVVRENAAPSGPIPPSNNGGTTISTLGNPSEGPSRGVASGGVGEPPKGPDNSENNNLEDVNEYMVNKEKERQDAITKEYSDERSKLFAELDEYEQMFIDDAKAENLNPGDNEFNMMMNERTVNPDRIFNYLSKIEVLNQKENFDRLDEYEKMFVEDAKADNLQPGDNEFAQMMGERTINQERVLSFYKKNALSQLQLEKIEELKKILQANKEELPLEESSGRSL